MSSLGRLSTLVAAAIVAALGPRTGSATAPKPLQAHPQLARMLCDGPPPGPGYFCSGGNWIIPH